MTKCRWFLCEDGTSLVLHPCRATVKNFSRWGLDGERDCTRHYWDPITLHLHRGWQLLTMVTKICLDQSSSSKGISIMMDPATSESQR